MASKFSISHQTCHRRVFSVCGLQFPFSSFLSKQHLCIYVTLFEWNSTLAVAITHIQMTCALCVAWGRAGAPHVEVPSICIPWPRLFIFHSNHAWSPLSHKSSAPSDVVSLQGSEWSKRESRERCLLMRALKLMCPFSSSKGDLKKSEPLSEWPSHCPAVDQSQSLTQKASPHYYRRVLVGLIFLQSRSLTLLVVSSFFLFWKLSESRKHDY